MYRQLYQMGGIGSLPMDYGQSLQVPQQMQPSFSSAQNITMNPLLNYGQTPLTMAGGGIANLVPREQYGIGSKIKIAKRNDLYKVLIGAQGNGTLSNPGKIFFINKGTDAEGIVYDWETSKDKRYKGVFSTSTNYIINDYVYYSGYFYKALTNIAGDGTTFTATEWQLVNNDQIRSIDYLGYIPNDTGTIPEDLDYKGFFTPLSTYTIDEIVQYFNGNFYKAKRNIPLGYNEFVDVNGTIEVPAEDWELISFVPGGDTELKLDQTGLIEFGRDFDISDNGEVLVVSAKFDNDITKVVEPVFQKSGLNRIYYINFSRNCK